MCYNRNDVSPGVRRKLLIWPRVFTGSYREVADVKQSAPDVQFALHPERFVASAPTVAPILRSIRVPFRDHERPFG